VQIHGGAEVLKRWRGGVQRSCRGAAEVQIWIMENGDAEVLLRCTGADMHRCRHAQVHRCRYGGMEN